MALSKFSASVSLCRAFYRSCSSPQIIKTCAPEAFRQPAFASPCQYTQVQMISTSFCLHDRHISKRSSGTYPKLKINADKNSSSNSGQTPANGKPNRNGDAKDSENKTVAKAGNGKEEKKDEKPGIFQRFKTAYKEHGKVLIGVHLATSSVWFGSFWYLVHNGVDVVSFLERLGVSERILSPVKNSGAGDIALAYLLYKVATPARYTVTLTGTNYAIKYLRKVGKMAPQKEKMRDLVKDSQKAFKPKLTDSQRHRLESKLSTIQAKSKSRVYKMKGKSQRRLVQLRKFIRSTAKRKT